jgi:hypothetical protein
MRNWNIYMKQLFQMLDNRQMRIMMPERRKTNEEIPVIAVVLKAFSGPQNRLGIPSCVAVSQS